MIRIPSLLLIALLLFTASAAAADEMTVAALPVRLETGLIQGVPNRDADVVSFKGIPYAAAPVGELRWREPQPPLSWVGVRRADHFGPSCPQPVNSGAPPYTAEFSMTGETREDCLFLNLWVPARHGAEKLPVLFFIHGGAGTHGSGAVPVYDGESLAKKGIIVITLNFRLGLLAGMGHPQLTAESPHHACGNYGFLDMIAALRWVHRNIDALGGDPQKITICGQSSGCLAVHYLTTSPLAKGLFRGAIAVSFSYDKLLQPHSIPFLRQKEQNGVELARARGVASLDDLRKIPVADLLAGDPKGPKLIHLNSSVVTDGWAFPLAYPDALDKGLECDVPTLTGLTLDDAGPPAEFLQTTVASFPTDLPAMFGLKQADVVNQKDALLALCPVTTDQEARQMMKRVQVEYRMACLLHWAARRAKAARTPVYAYCFEQPIPWPQHPEFGVFHSSDLVYEFNNLDKLDRPWTADDRRIADDVSSYWVNFVKTGNPNDGHLPDWQPLDPANPSSMALGIHCGPREVAESRRLTFYHHLIEAR